MRVLAVDPGLTRCGVGVVDGVPGRRLTLVEVGVVRTPAGDPTPRRLVAIEDEHRGCGSTAPARGRRDRAGLRRAQRLAPSWAPPRRPASSCCRRAPRPPRRPAHARPRSRPPSAAADAPTRRRSAPWSPDCSGSTRRPSRPTPPTPSPSRSATSGAPAPEPAPAGRLRCSRAAGPAANPVGAQGAEPAERRLRDSPTARPQPTTHWSPAP